MSNKNIELWSSDNILYTTAATKVQKGGGVNAILGLLQDLLAFQDKVSGTAEAQDMNENRQKLENFQSNLGKMYEELLEMARGGVRSIRQDPEQETKHPIMMNDNTIQQIP